MFGHLKDRVLRSLFKPDVEVAWQWLFTIKNGIKTFAHAQYIKQINTFLATKTESFSIVLLFEHTYYIPLGMNNLYINTARVCLLP